MIVDIVDKYCTDDNNPIKNLRLKEKNSTTQKTRYHDDYSYVGFLLILL